MQTSNPFEKIELSMELTNVELLSLASILIQAKNDTSLTRYEREIYAKVIDKINSITK